jgi:hypothetical protein
MSRFCPSVIDGRKGTVLGANLSSPRCRCFLLGHHNPRRFSLHTPCNSSWLLCRARGSSHQPVSIMRRLLTEPRAQHQVHGVRLKKPATLPLTRFANLEPLCHCDTPVLRGIHPLTIRPLKCSASSVVGGRRLRSHVLYLISALFRADGTFDDN